MKHDIRSVTNTGLDDGITDYSVDTETTDGPQDQEETTYTFANFTEWFGYYHNIPELKKAIHTPATWVLGQGYETDTASQVILDNMTGWGEDDFTSILWNMFVIKKVNGDSFAEIIRDEKGNLLNIKPLTPERMKIVVNNKGVIKRYEYLNVNKKDTIALFQPKDIFHLVNDRVADNIHGDSVVEALKWLIDARNEAMVDLRRIAHRSSIRVLYVDEDDTAKLTTLKVQYKNAIENGEVLILPGKRGENEFQDLTIPPIEAFLAWIKYLENAFYKAVGTPKTLAGDAEGIPESGGKMVVLTHEPTYIREVTSLEADIWNQLAIRVKFNRQASLQDSAKKTENKNINQTQAAQPSDTQA